MSGEAFLAIALSSLLVTHLAATATKVLQDIAWHELQEYCRRRERQRFDQIHDHADEVATSMETLMFLSVTVFALAGMGWMESQLMPSSRVAFFLIGVVIGTFVLLAAAVWIPKAIAEVTGTAFVYHTWHVWRGISRVVRPLTWGATLAPALLRRLLGITRETNEEEALEDEIRAIVVEGQHDGLIDSDVREMIEGVIELDDANVADIMTPRDKMDVMSLQLDWDQILQHVTQIGRTRIPVYDSSPNEIVGVLYVKDLFAALQQNDESRRPLADILRESWTVPASMHLDELLQQFLQTRNHLALVVDEYNAVTGLVTIEDVLEEIVGEIVDESDKEDLAEIRVIDDNHAIVQGRAHLQEINDQLGIDLPEDDEFDTIGGFLMHELGRVPKQGESIHWKNLKISVMEASGRRAELVRIASANSV